VQRASFHGIVPEFVTVEREGAVGCEGPVPGGRPKRADDGGTIGGVTARGVGAPEPPAGGGRQAAFARDRRIVIPRWIQLVGLPLVLVLAWIVVRATGHVVFVFGVAALVALLLDPLARGLQRLRLPRGLSVALVYLSFLAALGLVIFAVATSVAGETTTAANRLNEYFTHPRARTGQTSADRDVDRLQHWLDTHHLKTVRVQQRGHKLVRQIRRRDIGKYTHRVVTFAEGAAISIGKTLFALVLLLVISIYMLLDMPRLERAVDRRFPPRPGEESLLRQIERALASYVRGQLLLSLIIGATAGLGLWIFGLAGLLPNGSQYALLFGAWVSIAELIPYLGPWLGAIPPVAYALVVHPLSALWVVILFLAVHQLEGHVVVPKVMGNALRLHPLLVIFGLAAGAEIYGLPGALIALPSLAVVRAIWEFFGDRIRLEPWDPDAGPPAAGDVPVEVELVDPPPRASVEV
jgi:predicted PurR-regulated permease PerM